jgi:hypothetical protein
VNKIKDAEKPQKEPQQEAQQQPMPRSTLRALIYPFRLIVSPLKTFKEIDQNPRALGVFLVIVLDVLAAIGTSYFQASKIFLNSQTGSVSLLNSNLFPAHLASFVLQTTSSFVLNWILFSLLLLLLIKFTGGSQGGSWRSFIIIVGYAFIVVVIYIAVNAALISTLPNIPFDLSTWTGGNATLINDQFNAVWGRTVTYEALTYVSYAFQIWLVALGALAAYTAQEIKALRALLVSIIAYFASAVLVTLLTYFIP